MGGALWLAAFADGKFPVSSLWAFFFSGPSEHVSSHDADGMMLTILGALRESAELWSPRISAYSFLFFNSAAQKRIDVFQELRSWQRLSPLLLRFDQELLSRKGRRSVGVGGPLNSEPAV